MISDSINIIPLSVNAAWKGRRFKTDAYKSFETELLWKLPKVKMPDAPYEVSYTFGFSNQASDLDNPCKMVTDILCKRYGFDDKHIHKITIKKELVKKGNEYITFEIKTFEE